MIEQLHYFMKKNISTMCISRGLWNYTVWRMIWKLFGKKETLVKIGLWIVHKNKKIYFKISKVYFSGNEKEGDEKFIFA